MKKAILIVATVCILLVVLLFALVFFGVSNNSFSESFKASFIKSFKTSFVKNCTASNKSVDQQKICECCADKVTEQLTVKQLFNMGYTEQYITENVIPECMALHGLDSR